VVGPRAPNDEVMALPERHSAAREAADLVTMVERAPQRWRNRPRPGPDSTVRPPRRAASPPGSRRTPGAGTFPRNARAVLEHDAGCPHGERRCVADTTWYRSARRGIGLCRGRLRAWASASACCWIVSAPLRIRGIMTPATRPAGALRAAASAFIKSGHLRSSRRGATVPFVLVDVQRGSRCRWSPPSALRSCSRHDPLRAACLPPPSSRARSPWDAGQPDLAAKLPAALGQQRQRARARAADFSRAVRRSRRSASSQSARSEPFTSPAGAHELTDEAEEARRRPGAQPGRSHRRGGPVPRRVRGSCGWVSRISAASLTHWGDSTSRFREPPWSAPGPAMLEHAMIFFSIRRGRPSPGPRGPLGGPPLEMGNSRPRHPARAVKRKVQAARWPGNHRVDAAVNPTCSSVGASSQPKVPPKGRP
jgi:hypothetical protein